MPPATERQQLMMRRLNLDGLPQLVVPSGYALRPYRHGDEAAWAAIMNTGIGSDWTAARCVEQLTGRPQFRPDGLFFATVQDAAGPAIGSACAWTEHRTSTTRALSTWSVCSLSTVATASGGW